MIEKQAKPPKRVKLFGCEVWVRFFCVECKRRVGFQAPKTNHTSILARCQCGQEYTIRDGITDLDVGVFVGDCREAVEPVLGPVVPELPPLDANEHVSKLN